MNRPPHLLLLITGAPATTVQELTGVSSFLDLFVASTLGTDTGLDDAVDPTFSAIDIRTYGEDDPPLSLEGVDGVIMSGSSSMLGEDQPWMRYAVRTARRLVETEVPFFGVCFGHQVLAQALGGHVGRNPRGRAMGRIEAEKTAAGRICPIIARLKDPFFVNVSHRDVVLEKPAEAVITAIADHDPHFALRYGESAWTVQYHPEFSTEFMTAYIDERIELYDTDHGEGAAERVRAAMGPCPDGPATLSAFADYVARRIGRER